MRAGKATLDGVPGEGYMLISREGGRTSSRGFFEFAPDQAARIFEIYSDREQVEFRGPIREGGEARVRCVKAWIREMAVGSTEVVLTGTGEIYDHPESEND